MLDYWSALGARDAAIERRATWHWMRSQGREAGPKP